MLRFPHILGIIIGLASSVLLISSMGGHRTLQQSDGVMISECDGSIREIVIQYVRGANDISTVYREFLPMLDARVIVDVVCPDRESFDELKQQLPTISCVLHPIVTDHPITAWSRDRWVAIGPDSRDDSTVLLAPLHENGADAWPARAGDERVAFDIARACASRRCPAQRA